MSDTRGYQSPPPQRHRKPQRQLGGCHGGRRLPPCLVQQTLPRRNRFAIHGRRTINVRVPRETAWRRTAAAMAPGQYLDTCSDGDKLITVTVGTRLLKEGANDTIRMHELRDKARYRGQSWRQNGGLPWLRAPQCGPQVQGPVGPRSIRGKETATAARST